MTERQRTATPPEQRTPAGAKQKTGLPELGLMEWFRPGEHERVERVLADMERLGIDHIRTGVSWADCYTEEGRKWYKWFLPRLARSVAVLPCFTYTPPSIGIVPKTAAPPKNPKDFADFLDVMVTEYGSCFEWVELWNEPNNLNDWDWRLDPNWEIYSRMVIGAGYWMKQRGRKTVLGGMAPTDPNWLDLMCRRGVLEHIDAVGIHGFPGTWEYDWDDWGELIGRVRQVFDWHGVSPEIWITEGGYSTWRHDEYRQAEFFLDMVRAPADRVYWYSAHDLDPDLPHQDGFHEDERHYHFGLRKADGTEKLIFRLWAEGGREGVNTLSRMIRTHCRSDAENVRSPVRRSGDNPVLITGGAGFIGINLAARLVESGKRVLILDNLSRPGVEQNLEWLCSTYGDRVEVVAEDIRNPYVMQQIIRSPLDGIYHFAAQVAVTTSLEDPMQDFEVNLRGTLNILEAMRSLTQPPPLAFTSTNKVYGNLGDVALEKRQRRFEAADRLVRNSGISEDHPLDLHSPYGCSKGAADQYILDYTRSYSIPCVVFRMSCIYGPHQFGTEDQGWVAHFLIQAIEDNPIILYGDGRQVRDILFVDDLVDALLLAHDRIDTLSGNAYNIGGGVRSTTSLLELLDLLRKLHGRLPEVRFSDWRTGDQKYYVSDTRRFREATGWNPRVNVTDGVERLYNWLMAVRGSGRDRGKMLSGGKAA